MGESGYFGAKVMLVVYIYNFEIILQRNIVFIKLCWVKAVKRARERLTSFLLSKSPTNSHACIEDHVRISSFVKHCLRNTFYAKKNSYRF